MYIKHVNSQTRRDFYAIYKCEHCGHEYESFGYDDHNFHNNAIPNQECPECNKSSGGVPYHPKTPKYSDSEVI